MTPEKWIALSVRSPSAGPDNLVADALVRIGGRAVIEEDGAYTTYLPAPPDPRGFRSETEARLRRLTGRDDLEISWWWQEHRDWKEAWKKGLEPLRVTDRIVVTPSWQRPDSRPHDVVIAIDPGMAFGTAGHATTRGCLRLLERAVEVGDRVLDVGTGSGILAIAAACLGARRVAAIDSDPYACEAAVENAEANGVSDVVTVECGSAGQGPALDEAFDGVLANIEWHGLRPLLPGLRALMTPDGWLILGGILASQLPEVRGLAAALELLLVDEDAEDEWWAGFFRGRSGDPGPAP